MSIHTFNNIYNGPFKRYLIISKGIGQDVLLQSELVDLAFQTELQYIIFANNFKKPINEHLFLNPILAQVKKVEEFKTARCIYEQHINIIKESIKILYWITEEDPMKYACKIMEQIKSNTDKLLRSKFDQDIHTEWVNAWWETLEDIKKIIVQYYDKGFYWDGENSVPDPKLLGDIPEVDRCFDHVALFKEICQGEAILRVLRQTNLNPNLNSDVAEISEEVILDSEKEVFALDGNRWRIEYKNGNHKQLTIDDAEIDHVVEIYKCKDCTIVIGKKIAAMHLDSCEKVGVIFRSIENAVELIGCHNVRLHAFGVLPSVNMDTCTDVSVNLTKKALDAKIITSQCIGISVSYPFKDGYYRSYNIPWKQMTTIDTSTYTLKTSSFIENKKSAEDEWKLFKPKESSDQELNEPNLEEIECSENQSNQILVQELENSDKSCMNSFNSDESQCENESESSEIYNEY